LERSTSFQRQEVFRLLGVNACAENRARPILSSLPVLTFGPNCWRAAVRPSWSYALTSSSRGGEFHLNRPMQKAARVRRFVSSGPEDWLRDHQRVGARGESLPERVCRLAPCVAALRSRPYFSAQRRIGFLTLPSMDASARLT
jgi:hypothetical protein